MEYFPLPRRTEVLTHACYNMMNLKNIKLNKGSQLPKKNHMIGSQVYEISRKGKSIEAKSR